MRLSPQIKLAASLVALLFSAALIGDALGLLPRPEDRVREARKMISETLAVQLSDAAARGDNKAIARTLQALIERNEDIVFGELVLSTGESIATFGQPVASKRSVLDLSTLDHLVVPIFRDQSSWGRVQLQFRPSRDWGLRYVGFPLTSLTFIAFLCVSCFASYYLFLRRALRELNPTKAVPERVNAAFEVLAEGVLILDDNSQIVLANASFARRIGTTPEQLIGTSPDVHDWDLSGKGAQRYPWQIAMDTGEHVVDMRLGLRVDEASISFTVNAAPILDAAGRHRGVLITFDDVSSLEAKNTELARMLTELNETQRVIEVKNQELEILATRDALTGVLNRRSFLAAGERFVAESLERGAPMCALMVDIDHFKRVNDDFGHRVGDQAIKAVADALGTFFRKGDCVGRYGGEEFVVALPDTTADDAMATAERLRQHVATLTDGDELPMETLTVSIGVSELDASAANMSELMDRADRGLYKAKETGRNQVCRFDPEYVPAALRKPRGEQPVAEAASEQLRRDLESMKKRVREQADEIAYHSLYDRATRLPNQLLLADRIEQAIKQSTRTELPGAVISIGLSGYQQIAELESNDIAERLILQASRRVQAVIRSGDSISAVDAEQALTCSRVAHNELAILAVNLTDVRAAVRIVERVTQVLEPPIEVNGHKVVSRVYCGIALLPMDGSDAASLTRNAALARKFAERRTPNASGNAYFSSEIDAQAIKHARIAAQLHDALTHDKLSIVYQPKIHADTHEVIGVEALARWTSEELGPVSPDVFVELAEHLGMISLLTNCVVNQVCRDINAGRLGGVRVSINVSPLELGDSGTADRLLGILRHHGVPASRIGIELTESTFLNDQDLGRDILNTLRDAGILVSLDDFGTGYSSLNMLSQIPVDIIKIDRSFISQVHRTPTQHSIVQAIFVLARTLDMRVVAEGVSSEEEYGCLKLMGCTEMQGFLFAPPLDTAALDEYIAQAGVRPRFGELTQGQPVELRQSVR